MIQRALCPTLISRDQELSTLEDALLAAHRGDGGVVVLAGDAGIGKTRLATELRHRAAKIGCAVMWGGCSEAELTLPYLPFLEAIGNHLAGGDLTRIRDELGPARRQLGQLFPQLAPEGPMADGGDPTQAKLRLFEAVLELLAIPAREQGLVLVLEDLHWADSSTRELLDYITRRVRSSRVLVLATYRRDELHRRHPLLPTVQSWQRSGLVQIVELDDLSPDGVAAMVGAIFDEEHISDEFRDVMHARSEGNPFVLEEMLKEALDRGDIFPTENGWDRKSLDELRIPETVRDTILLRVDRLDDDQVALLRCAAVLGASFDYATLTLASGIDATRMEALLDTFVRQQLIEEDPAARGRLRFRHALTREAIYEDMTAPARERLHLRAADALALADTSSPGERAMHLIAANRAIDAVPLLLEAAQQAHQHFGFREAAALFQRALAHITDKPGRAAVLCQLGESLWHGGDARAAEGYLVEGIGLLEELGEDRRGAAHRITLGRCRWENGRPADARADYERSAEVLEAYVPSADLAMAYVRLAGLLDFNGQGAAAVEIGERAVETANACGADAARIWAYNFIGLGLVLTGHLDAGIDYVDRSRREAEERGFEAIAGNALHNGIVLRTGHLRARECAEPLHALETHSYEAYRNFALFDGAEASALLGDLRAAIATLREFLSRNTTEMYQTWARRELGRFLVEKGDLEEARRYLPRPDPAHERQDYIAECFGCICFHLADGNIAEALTSARLVESVARHTAAWLAFDGDAAVEAMIAAGGVAEAESFLARYPPDKRASDPYLRRSDARVALARGDAAVALEHADAARRTWTDAGYRIEESRTRLLLAHALEAAGDKVRAKAELQRLLADARDCGAGLLERGAVEALGRLGVTDVGSATVPATADAADELDGHPAIQPPDAVGERLVTVLFADVRGYTRMTATIPPPELADRIATFQRWATTELERHHGLVDKFAGDAVMATFNVSGASVDHCLHAVQAARSLRDKAALIDLGIGVGIAVGPAVVGRMTAGANVSVLGEATNLASRLQASAAAGEIVLDSNAHRRVRDWLGERGIGVVAQEMNVKGLDAPVTVFTIGTVSG